MREQYFNLGIEEQQRLFEDKKARHLNIPVIWERDIVMVRLMELVSQSPIG